MTFIKGQTAWNKGKKFSAEICMKMSASKKAIHFIPPNKIVLDEERLTQLYQQGYGCNYLAQLFKVNRVVIKKRLRALGINRTAKQTCSSPVFKLLMSTVRLKTLSDNPHELKRVTLLLQQKDVIEARLKGISRTPTSIECLIYDELEQRDIPF